jgi:TolA-binding protein
MNKKYTTAYNLYMKSNYVVAIKFYDDYIKNSPNGALATKAELERSDCYYQLGYQAFHKENWLLASRLFYLANSVIADSKLDNCYYKLAEESLNINDINTALDYYDSITTYLTDSELIPEVLFNKIKIYIDSDKKLEAFNDYHLLWSNYPDNKFTISIQPLIDNLIPYYMNQAVEFRKTADYDNALNILFKLNQYPTQFKDEILIGISDLYLLKAEDAITEHKYTQAKKYYSEVIVYDPQKETIVNKRMDEICNEFIQEGSRLVENYKFDEAFAIYETCYELLPEYQKSTDAIEEAKKLKESYTLAFQYKNKAESYENDKEYVKALEFYRISYSSMQMKEVQNKIYMMSNTIKAQKDPKGFALEIIQSFKKGIIVQGVNGLQSDLKDKYGENVKSSGWKVSYALGEFKYEVRFDILASEENYYFVWRINLQTREIVPLNKISEELLKQ